jgi:L,D-transpeptidase ErfK/SrfK
MDHQIFAVGLLLYASSVPALELELPPPGSSVVGAVYQVKARYESTLAALAQQHDMGFQELLQANPDADPWLPGEGTMLTIPAQFVLPPAPREGIVINLPEFRLYYFPPEGRTVVTFPIGIGRSGFRTPLLDTHIVTRIENPSWTPTESIRREHRENGDELPRVVLAGPDNPLGHLAIQLAYPGYFIHGTNKPFGVGQRISHGCVRLYPADIEALVALAPNGTRVQVIDAPHKVGSLGGRVYLESHPELNGELQLTRMVQAVIRGTPEPVGSERPITIDWQLAERLVRAGSGLPGPISPASPPPSSPANSQTN